VTLDATTDPWAASAVWAIGRFHDGDTTVFWPSTRAERARAAAFAAPRLAALGIAAGDRVLLVSMMSDGVQIVPYEDALRQLGAVMTPADATGSDAARVATVVERAAPRAVIGLNTATLDGLESLGLDASILSSVGVLVADGLAAARLENLGLAPFRWLTVGPAVAIECPERSGLHLDGQGWDPANEQRVVMLRPRAHRAEDPVPVRTGVRAQVVHGPCSCGSDDPRLMSL
jgi:hypothetical protein